MTASSLKPTAFLDRFHAQLYMVLSERPRFRLKYALKKDINTCCIPLTVEQTSALREHEVIRLLGPQTNILENLATKQNQF